MSYQIAIDGPSGAGKTTVAKMLAQAIGFVYVDTGAFYRALAVYFSHIGIKDDNLDAIAQFCEDPYSPAIYASWEPDGTQVMSATGFGIIPEKELRTEAVSQSASRISSMAGVRTYLLNQQRRIARENNVIMEGRDIGTTVLPDATVKVFLTADQGLRAFRRYMQLTENAVLAKDRTVTLDDIQKDMMERDDRDANRSVSPLKYDPDTMVLVNNTYLSAQQTMSAIMLIAAEHGVPLYSYLYPRCDEMPG